MRTVLKISMVLMGILLFAGFCAAGDFELVKADRNISLYERWVKHNGNTVRELKADFFVKAADGGMAEVALSQAAEKQASDKRVKSLANMLVQDHTAANDKLKQLAAERNVTLPAAISTEHQNTINDITAKKGSAFDKAYVDHLVDAHKSTIDMFKKAADDVKDETVRNFINDMIPKLQGHLDKAEALQKALK